MDAGVVAVAALVAPSVLAALHGQARAPRDPHRGASAPCWPGGRRCGRDELRYWNAASRNWVHDTATPDVYIGGDSTVQLTHQRHHRTRPIRIGAPPE